jgi:hypothetical protein
MDVRHVLVSTLQLVRGRSHIKGLVLTSFSDLAQHICMITRLYYCIILSSRHCPSLYSEVSQINGSLRERLLICYMQPTIKISMQKRRLRSHNYTSGASAAWNIRVPSFGYTCSMDSTNLPSFSSYRSACGSLEARYPGMGLRLRD